MSIRSAGDNKSMPEIRAALVTLPWSDRLIESLRLALAPAKVHVASRHDPSAIAAALRHVDVAMIAGDIDYRFLNAPNLKWVHCGHAGLDRSADPAVFDRDLRITSSSGRSSLALAEHAMLFMLALSFRLHRFYDAQRAHQWGVAGQRSLQPLYGQTLGIVGLGHVGLELATRAKAFGMTVIAYRRRDIASEWVDRLYSSDRGDNLHALLAQSNYVVLAVPLSDHTRRLIDSDAIARMRPRAHLINIARGGLVDEKALVAALASGHLAGAAIDVADEEPLPADSPLWDAPNLLITPHFTPQLPDRDERALELLLDNLRRYREEEPMLNVLTRDDIFTKNTCDKPRDSAIADIVERIQRRRRKLIHWVRTR